MHINKVRVLLIGIYLELQWLWLYFVTVELVNVINNRHLNSIRLSFEGEHINSPRKERLNNTIPV